MIKECKAYHKARGITFPVSEIDFRRKRIKGRHEDEIISARFDEVELSQDRQGRRYIILHKSGNDVLDTQLAQAFESWGYKVATNPGAFLVAW